MSIERRPSAGQGEPQADLAATYDLYFACGDYERRYPAPNPATLVWLRKHGLHHARSMLDLGCGNGRYALALLGPACESLTGCDPSRVGLAQFRSSLQSHPLGSRVRLVHGGAETLTPENRFDVFLLLFGVLGLIGDRASRVRVLKALRGKCLPEARLALTVPSAWRRFPGARLRAWRESLQHTESAPSGRDIRFWRHFRGQAHAFHYHLFVPSGLREELAEAGWRLVLLEAERVLSESLVCRWTWLAAADRFLRQITPARLGYGMRAIAVPTQDLSATTNKNCKH